VYGKIFDRTTFIVLSFRADLLAEESQCLQY